MSNIYALEPHTNGKVILHTTSGDIEVELWGKEAPRATRNFIQLCLEGYYDNTIFHRVVPGFLVQGGDPTGTGQGGESIYEDGFPDEFHSRLRFNRRGLVGVANTGQDDNGSQFFITLDRADELTKKHTLFGRVAGDTLFNVMKLAEAEVDGNERPLYPTKIKSAEVILNPFDDIVPRITAEEKKKAKALEKKKLEEAELAKKKKKGQKKQLNLLSFGEEAAEFEPPESESKKAKKSAYDFAESLVTSTKSTEDKPVEKKKTLDEKLKERLKLSEEKRKKSEESKPEESKPEESKPKEPEEKSVKVDEPKSTAAETIEKLKQEIRNISKEPVVEEEPKKKEKKKSLVALEREKYAAQQNKKKSKADKSDDSDVFNKLMAFQKKLSTAKPIQNTETKKQEKICELHSVPNCESCFDSSIFEKEDNTDEGWISHQLVFDKDLKGKSLMQRKETVDDYVVIDPRDREAQAKQEEYEKKRSVKSRSSYGKNEDDYNRKDQDDRKRRNYDDHKRRDYDDYRKRDSKRSRHDDDYNRRR